MPFAPLTDAETAALDALSALRSNRDRQGLFALAALRDIGWIDEAARLVLAAPSLVRLPLRRRAAAEAAFAVPRADALARLADAEDAIAKADVVIAGLRATLGGEASDA